MTIEHYIVLRTWCENSVSTPLLTYLLHPLQLRQHNFRHTQFLSARAAVMTMTAFGLLRILFPRRAD